MKTLLQRVKYAGVTVAGKQVSHINQGLLIFLGVEKNDTAAQADFLAKKAANLRIFEDENQKMNLSVQDIKGEVLVVSQFTLAGDTSRGNRPGFETAAAPQDANALYKYFSDRLRNVHNLPVQNGIFQADMQVELLNDGPVTFMLEK
mgnify:FL=1